MAVVVFVRGVNVGGHKAFQPSVLAREMSELDVVNVGAAGTFVIRKTVSPATVRAELARRLPFTAEFMICPSRELMALVSTEPFGGESSGQGITRFVSILAKRPRKLPALPFGRPAGAMWQVQVIAVTGRFALSIHRRMGRTFVYPNEVVEKNLGVSATTRNWNTISTICDILKGR